MVVDVREIFTSVILSSVYPSAIHSFIHLSGSTHLSSHPSITTGNSKHPFWVRHSIPALNQLITQGKRYRLIITYCTGRGMYNMWWECWKGWNHLLLEPGFGKEASLFLPSVWLFHPGGNLYPRKGSSGRPMFQFPVSISTGSGLEDTCSFWEGILELPNTFSTHGQAPWGHGQSL